MSLPTNHPCYNICHILSSDKNRNVMIRIIILFVVHVIAKSGNCDIQLVRKKPAQAIVFANLKARHLHYARLESITLRETAGNHTSIFI